VPIPTPQHTVLQTGDFRLLPCSLKPPHCGAALCHLLWPSYTSQCRSPCGTSSSQSWAASLLFGMLTPQLDQTWTHCRAPGGTPVNHRFIMRQKNRRGHCRDLSSGTASPGPACPGALIFWISSCTAALPRTLVCDAWLPSLLPSSSCREDHTAFPSAGCVGGHTTVQSCHGV